MPWLGVVVAVLVGVVALGIASERADARSTDRYVGIPTPDVASDWMEAGSTDPYVGRFLIRYNDPDCEGSPDSDDVYVARGTTGPYGERTITWFVWVGRTAYYCPIMSTEIGEIREIPWLSNPHYVGCYAAGDCEIMLHTQFNGYFPSNFQAGQCWGEAQPCSPSLSAGASSRLLEVGPGPPHIRISMMAEDGRRTRE